MLDLANVYTIGDLRGRPQVWVAVQFYTDYSITYSEGAYLDNLLVRKCTSGSCPAQTMEEIGPDARLIDIPFALTADDPDRAPTYEGQPPKAANN